MKKDIFSVLISNFSSAGIAFALNILLARIMTLTDYGKINLIFSIVSVIFTVFIFGFTNSLVIFYNKNNKDILPFINGVFFKYFAITVIPIASIVLIVKYYYNFTYFEYCAIVLNILSFLLYRYFIAIYQAQANWKLYNFYNVLSNFFKFLFIFLGIIFHKYLIGNNLYLLVILSYTIYPFFLLLIIFTYGKNNMTLSFEHNNELFKSFLNILIPLGLSNILIIIYMRADIFIIEKYLGVKFVGIYVAANSLALIFPLITTSLMNVFLQKSSNDKNFIKFIFNNQKKYFPYLIIILILSILVSKPLFLLLFGSKFIYSINIFRILLIAYIGGIFFTPLESFFYSNYQKRILLIKLFQMLFIVIFDIIFIQIYGLISIAIIVVLSRIFAWLYIYINTRKIYKENL